VLVNLGNPLQHVSNTVVGNPHAERFIQPHSLVIEQQNSQPAAKQCDYDHQPGRKFFNIDFFVHLRYICETYDFVVLSLCA
jgi:hypothetical protein